MAVFNFNDPEPDRSGQSKTEPAPETGGRWRFPFKTALAIVVLAAGLLSWRWYMDHNKGLDPGIFAETFRLHWPQPPAPVVPKAPTVQQPMGNERPAEISPVFADDTNNLDPFYGALWNLERRKLGLGNPDQARTGIVVTVLHYGDSPTTADLITGDVRAQLQDRFGDAGRATRSSPSPGPGMATAVWRSAIMAGRFTPASA
jgi:hypothetical protein